MSLAPRAGSFPVLRVCAPIVALITIATPAAAQPAEPIGPFVADVRGSLARYGQSDNVAAGLKVRPNDLPARGLGFDVGGHWYFFRWRAITFGVGGNFQFSRGEHQTQADPSKGIKAGPVVVTQLRTLTPQLSFNFGTGRGWSYISGGLSPVRLRMSVAEEELQTRSSKTINYGGGARWFIKPHVAFTFDLRFYAMSPMAAEAGFVAMPRMTLMVFSAGLSLK